MHVTKSGTKRLNSEPRATKKTEHSWMNLSLLASRNAHELLLLASIGCGIQCMHHVTNTT
jgi:hypothetical protein